MLVFIILEKNCRKEVLDSSFVSCLVEIMKSSTPDLQRKAASILEFATMIDSSMDIIISADIESALIAIFQQEILNGKYEYEKFILVDEAFIEIPKSLQLMAYGKVMAHALCTRSSS